MLVVRKVLKRSLCVRRLTKLKGPRGCVGVDSLHYRIVPLDVIFYKGKLHVLRLSNLINIPQNVTLQCYLL
jgi:hypothetical protein